MQIPCPNCRTKVYSTRQKYWASAFWPLTCTRCGAMAGPSWWPISVAIVSTIALCWLVTRYVPLGRISRLEVMAFRIGGALLAAFLMGSVILALAGYRAGL